MSDDMKMGLDSIREYWRNQAVEHGPRPDASWTDVNAIQLEVNEMSRRLKSGMRVIDIGCANGFSTLQYATQHNIDIKGVDFIPEMISAAKLRLKSDTAAIKGSVDFQVGDIMRLDEPDKHYDVAIVTRVVINLGDTERQKTAIREAARVVKPGGLLLLSEATKEGLSQLNAFRAEWGLEAIPEPSFNLYVDQGLVKSAAPDLLELVEVSNFASTYFVGTRILKPLLARGAQSSVNVGSPNMEWNRFFSMLPAAGDYGTQKLFVLQRRR